MADAGLGCSRWRTRMKKAGKEIEGIRKGTRAAPVGKEGHSYVVSFVRGRSHEAHDVVPLEMRGLGAMAHRFATFDVGCPQASRTPRHKERGGGGRYHIKKGITFAD